MVEKGLVVSLISIFIFALGVFAIIKMNREAFPNVNLDLVQISVAQPGASPQEIERLIVIPIEQELKILSGIDKITSVSFPGSARITLELDHDASNREQITNEVQLAIDRARLPADLPNKPYVLEIDARVFPVIQLAFSAPYGEVKMKQISSKIEDDLLRINGVGRVRIQGDRKEEIRITVKPELLKKHRITIGDITTVLQKWNVNVSGGGIDTEQGQKTVRIVGEYKNADDVANLVLRSNQAGQSLRLMDVADVKQTLIKAETYQDVSGEPAIHMVVMKLENADIIDTVDDIMAYLKTVPVKYGDKIVVDSFDDFSKFARLRLGVLTNNGLVGFFLVLFTLVIFLRPSVAVSTTIGIPLVFLTGLFILHMMGVTLNLISMMAFIMVLGMLVDDAIILGENITFHMEQGMPPMKAAVVGAKELMGPVTTTILTTVVAFVPLLFLSGIIGKFIVAIPIVVILLLVLSWLESFLILPNHVAHLTNTSKVVGERRWLLWLEDKYASILEFTLNYHWWMVLLSVFILVGSVFMAKSAMHFQLFPSVGIEQYIVRVTAEPGTSLEEMRKRLLKIDVSIRNSVDEKYVDATLITSGKTAMDAGDPMIQIGSRFGQIRVIYIPYTLRTEHDAINDMFILKKKLVEQYPDLEFAFQEIQPGPPTGRALQVEIVGDDYDIGEDVASKLMDYLKNIDGVTTIESDMLPGDPEIRIVFDRTISAFAGIDLATAGSHIRAAVDGLRVATTRWGTDEVDITIRFPETSYQQQFQQLQELQIPNSRGGMITMSKVAKFYEHDGFTNIRHKDNQRIISVLANIDSRIITSTELNAMVEKNQSDWLSESNNERVTINYGGENEKNQESVNDLAFAFGFALLAVFFILAVQFNNLGYPIAVMLAIPFGAIGVIVSFYFHDLLWKPMPLSFMSTLGMVALTGVVVNSSLILLVFIQRSIKEGMDRREAIVYSCRRRLRAVLLTAITTIVGLLPTAYGWGGLDPFVSSMALALSWGLIFATLITLIVIPAIFMAGSDIFVRKAQKT
ncbi:RND multidrug efflux transporter; Acriflavin resistance protein [hydrothermal vent metagenome]|uniref:RND multidrug efflux transporter Acriflavin resistance protein n=1 Tax=hydrothermal vent metagenome TaxID=652676 RepID=A0A3B1AH43_9ZZZZ